MVLKRTCVLHLGVFLDFLNVILFSGVEVKVEVGVIKDVETDVAVLIEADVNVEVEAEVEGVIKGEVLVVENVT